jgi:hypothetical protein
MHLTDLFISSPEDMQLTDLFNLADIDSNLKLEDGNRVRCFEDTRKTSLP